MKKPQTDDKTENVNENENVDEPPENVDDKRYGSELRRLLAIGISALVIMGMILALALALVLDSVGKAPAEKTLNCAPPTLSAAHEVPGNSFVVTGSGKRIPIVDGGHCGEPPTVSLGEYTATYYISNTPTTGWTMADGQRVFTGAVAADVSIPLGTEMKLVFPDGSERWVLVCDRGVSGRIIDVWVPSIEDVPERGIDKIQVFTKDALK